MDFHVAQKRKEKNSLDEMKFKKAPFKKMVKWSVRGTHSGLQTNPPGAVLFKWALEFVALMHALNCFGTCHER